ncbi:zinc ABC transporter substrate-binding protein [Neomegalonema sp.]|uniref:metal ABC transporter solute-binding protein, Zn/Mn family n=1 Tax=Neomegalonema sp. TaxID=2039713 RepID=UPI00262D2848|nr:zinc ABC transporter substrate-binding protein [Neomegalonema sp.]MDD2867601.1 zinc ABC transporter substrate-binding protein [Neomegalonema sp.]
MRLTLACGFYVITSMIAAPLAAQEVKAVASFSILADFVKQVGGERVRVQALVGPDGDAHNYEPRPSDAAALARADVVFVNGLGFEGFLDRLVAASETRAPVIVASEGVAAREAEENHDHDHDHDHESHAEDHDHDHHDHGPLDPHAWQSVADARIYVGNIRKGLCAADPEGCPDYEARAAAYDEKLAALDAELRAAFSALPEARRRVIVSHDAFAYFGQAYGLTFLAAQGRSAEAAPSAARIAALIRQAREEKAAAIFVENIADPRLAERVAAETGLKMGGRLYSDALSGPGGVAPDYLSMMRANAEALLEALR